MLQACVEYVLSLPGVKYDPTHVVAAGVSNGGAIVTPLASRYSIYTHAMMLHARRASSPKPRVPSPAPKRRITSTEPESDIQYAVIR